MSLDILSFVHGQPCETDEIGLAEAILGHAIPIELRRAYKLANGFLGPTSAAFLYPLHTPQEFNSETATGFTLFLRSDTNQPDFWKRSVAFGDFGIGATWGINIDTGQVFEWWPEDGELVTELGESIMDVWVVKKAWYDSVA